MTSADDVWNRAAQAWQADTRLGFRSGDVALAGLLAFHSTAMNDGVLAAVEEADGQQIQEAVAGFRYYGLNDAAEVLEVAIDASTRVEALALPEAEALERQLDLAYSECLPSDQTLIDMFEKHFAAHSDQYAPLV